ncbi:MAG: aminotransferase class V-fold PLP-dependent enzyme [Corynebacteriales bacterium]|nr:aminotransferase class V-fold PLP-dependent enzyme [Mycobacteriales bacterium]
MRPHPTDETTQITSLDFRPNGAESEEVLRSVLNFVAQFDEEPHTDFKIPYPSVAARVTDVLSPPPANGRSLHDLLDTIKEAGQSSANTSGPRCFQHIPGSTMLSAAAGEFLSRILNRHSAFADQAPLLTAMEQGVIRWLCTEFGLPATAGGSITSGGSISTLSLLAAARIARCGDEWQDAKIYLTEFTHGSAARALRILGFRPGQVTRVASDPHGRMLPDALREAITTDLREGANPFLVVATTGTTDNGAIDPIAAIADVAEQHNLWLHVDAAYGGFFQLTERGRAAFVGIERADSIVLDPHKGLFMPFGTGVLLVRDENILRDAFRTQGAYLEDHIEPYPLGNRCELGPELSTEARGLRMWLPLQLHGLAAFRATLQEKLDLAQLAYDALVANPALEVHKPELSIVVFAMTTDAKTEAMLHSINSSGAGTVSSTKINGKTYIRLCVLNSGTHRSHVDGILKVILNATN